MSFAEVGTRLLFVSGVLSVETVHYKDPAAFLFTVHRQPGPDRSDPRSDLFPSGRSNLSIGCGSFYVN